MRAFVRQAWPDWEVVQRVAQLPWRHQIAVVERPDSAEQRLWKAAWAVERACPAMSSPHQITVRPQERAGRAITNCQATLPQP